MSLKTLSRMPIISSYTCAEQRGGNLGVAYRYSKDMKDCTGLAGGVLTGEIVHAVLVEENWFKTNIGFWLPMTKDGHTLFTKVEDKTPKGKEICPLCKQSRETERKPKCEHNFHSIHFGNDLRRRLATTSYDRRRRRLAATPYELLSPAEQVIKRFHAKQRQKPYIARLEKLIDEISDLP